MNRYILKNRKPVLVKDLVKWAEAFGKMDRVVDRTLTSADVTVSTVFLGIDHSFGGSVPVLFETMVFGGVQDGLCERSRTWDEAVRTHRNVVAHLTFRCPYCNIQHNTDATHCVSCGGPI